MTLLLCDLSIGLIHGSEEPLIQVKSCIPFGIRFPFGYLTIRMTVKPFCLNCLIILIDELILHILLWFKYNKVSTGYLIFRFISVLLPPERRVQNLISTEEVFMHLEHLNGNYILNDGSVL